MNKDTTIIRLACTDADIFADHLMVNHIDMHDELLNDTMALYKAFRFFRDPLNLGDYNSVVVFAGNSMFCNHYLNYDGEWYELHSPDYSSPNSVYSHNGHFRSYCFIYKVLEKGGTINKLSSICANNLYSRLS